MKVQLLIDGAVYEVEVEDAEETQTSERRKDVALPAIGSIRSVVLPTASVPGSSFEAEIKVDERKVCRSPMAGIIVRVNARPGQQLEEGAPILVLEAMKMEANISATAKVTVRAVRITAGDAVKPGQILVEFE